MNIDLNELEIRIMLRCKEGLLNKNYASKLFRKYGLKGREKAIIHLSKLEYIVIRKLPKPGTKKTPVFYEITKEGSAWVKNYLKNYPK